MQGSVRRFVPGETIVIREVLRGKVWTVRPVTVIEDSDRQLVSYLAPGTLIDYPLDVEHGKKCFSMWMSGEWTLHKKPFLPPGVVRIAPQGQPFEVMAPLSGTGGVIHWYVNFQRPLRRTPTGFDTMDETLDLVVTSDFSSWTRKDEDELELAVAMGLYDLDERARIERACRAVEDQLRQGIVPWDCRWQDWEAH